MRFFLLFAYITAFVWLLNAEAQQNINSLTTKDIKVNGNLEVNSVTIASKPCPVMSESQRDAIASPQSGRCVYNSNTNQLNIFNGTIWKSGSVPNCSTQTIYIGTARVSLGDATSSTTHEGNIADNAGSAPLSGPRKYFCHGEIQ